MNFCWGANSPTDVKLSMRSASQTVRAKASISPGFHLRIHLKMYLRIWHVQYTPTWPTTRCGSPPTFPISSTQCQSKRFGFTRFHNFLWIPAAEPLSTFYCCMIFSIFYLFIFYLLLLLLLSSFYDHILLVLFWFAMWSRGRGLRGGRGLAWPARMVVVVVLACKIFV